jgi:hypothetical protein
MLGLEKRRRGSTKTVSPLHDTAFRRGRPNDKVTCHHENALYGRTRPILRRKAGFPSLAARDDVA